MTTGQHRVTEFMEGLGFRWGMTLKVWVAPEKILKPWVTPDQATFMYRQSLKARREQLKLVRLESEVTLKGARYLEERIAELDRLLGEDGDAKRE